MANRGTIRGRDKGLGIRDLDIGFAIEGEGRYRFVLSQVPKCEGPGAPKVSWVDYLPLHLGHSSFDGSETFIRTGH